MFIGKCQQCVAVLYIVSDIIYAQAYWTHQPFPVRNMPLEIKQYHAADYHPRRLALTNEWMTGWLANSP
jgi:hypothetical protein